MKIDITNPSDTIKFAVEFARNVIPGTPILLFGNLGTGKTFFTTHLIRSLTGENTTVPSPTFSLLQNYTCSKGSISHYDFYRINDASELYELDIDNSLSNNITIIEWPEIMFEYIKQNFPYKRLNFTIKNNKRFIEIID